MDQDRDDLLHDLAWAMFLKGEDYFFEQGLDNGLLEEELKTVRNICNGFHRANSGGE